MLSAEVGTNETLKSIHEFFTDSVSNQTHQLSPWHDEVHLVEKHTFALALGDRLESGDGEADLFHFALTALNSQWLAGFAEIS